MAPAAAGATRASRATRKPAGHDALIEAAGRLGIDTLHPEQEQVIADVLAGRDVLMVLPTGFGKSACYQVPSMLLDRPVLVISPLQALLKDQDMKLAERGVPCVRLDSTVRGRARKAALARIAEGGSLLVMTTPETLSSDEAEEVLTKSGVAMAAIDEAHCVSEWGHDFRPAYLRIGARLRELGRPPVLALTATATPKVRTSIVRSLGMRDPEVVASSPDRANLAFEALRCDDDTRPRALLHLVRRLRRPGIVYCATTREVDAVYGFLHKFGIPVHRYHGRMTAKGRVEEQEKFMKSGRRTVMVATSAFGLGIDKPDIRFVLHYQTPASLEQYVQEAGRAGRDGRQAACIMLSVPDDRSIHEALLTRSRIRPDQLYRLGRALAAWSDEGRDPDVDALAFSAEQGPRIAMSLLAKLEEAGLVAIEKKTVSLLKSRAELAEGSRGLAGQFDTLRTEDGRRLDEVAEYARDTGCRAVYLREYFGEDGGSPCGLCDSCRDCQTVAPEELAPLAPPKKSGRSRRKKKGKPTRRTRRGGRRRRRSPAASRDSAAAKAGAAPSSNPRTADGAGDGSERPARRRRRRRSRRRSRKPRTGGAPPA